jgi:hypothetical protein
MLTEAELRNHKTCEIGEYHVWFFARTFNASLDWHNDDEPAYDDDRFATYDELCAFLSGQN